MYVYVYMGTKTITIKEDAYERLKAHKRENESFSDVVSRLAGQDRDVWAGYGARRGDDQFRRAIEEGMAGFDEDFDRRQRRLREGRRRAGATTDVDEDLNGGENDG